MLTIKRKGAASQRCLCLQFAPLLIYALVAQASTLPQSRTKGDAAPGSAIDAPLPELLSPAGDWDCARAAVENGADAIYFGLDKFNARMRAHNFTASDLPRLMEFLHQRGVKGYVTLNTLIFEDELAEAEQCLR